MFFVLQKYIRGWLSRVRYRRSQRQIIMVQCQVRRFIARKQFKKLKIEAKSVEHQKKLNQGLENKIISLQQRLTESEKISKTMKVRIPNVKPFYTVSWHSEFLLNPPV